MYCKHNSIIHPFGPCKQCERDKKALRAIKEAKQALKKGDRIKVSRCGGMNDDLFPTNISKVNGITRTFG